MLAASIAQMDAKAGVDMLDRMFNQSLVRLEAAAGRARQHLEAESQSPQNLKEALNIVHWASRREAKALASVSNALPGESTVSAHVETLTKRLAARASSDKKAIETLYPQLAGQSPKLTEEERRAQNMVPARNPAFPGPISAGYVIEKLAEKERTFDDPFTRLQRYEIGAFIDGKLNVAEIRDAVSAECGPVSLTDVVKYMDTLESINLISYERRHSSEFP
jgi:hypothetical protein